MARERLSKHIKLQILIFLLPKNEQEMKHWRVRWDTIKILSESFDNLLKV
jgi:hypothetical protein